MSLQSAQIETPFGMMLAIANEQALCFLDFVNAQAISALNRKLVKISVHSTLGPWKGEDERWGESSFQQQGCHLPRLERKIKRLSLQEKSAITPGTNQILKAIEKELGLYFKKKIQTFQTPYQLSGSAFQQAAWKTLLNIPYGTTISYAQEAAAMSLPRAVRAVANANGANQLAIVIPCHRVISSDGTLGGYGSGLARKKALLELEKNR